MRMENDLIARKLNLLTVFFPALAPSYKEIILNSFDQYSLLKAYVRRIMDNTSDTGGIGYKKGKIKGKIPEITPKKFPW